MFTPRLSAALLITAALLAALPATAFAGGVFASASAATSGARVGAASAGHRLSILLSLRADDASLTAYAAAVSNPSSPLFRKYLSPAQIAQRFGSSKADRARVTKALRAAGLTPRTGLGGFWIETEATVAQASALFSTRFASYRARTSGKRYVAPSGSPQLPPSLAGTVTGVVGLDDAPTVRSDGERPAALSAGLVPAAEESSLAPLTRAQTLALNASETAAGSSVRGNLGTQSGCEDGVSTGKPYEPGPGPPVGYIPSYTPNQVSSAYGLSTLHSNGFEGEGQRIAVIEMDGFRRSDLEAAGACFGYKAPPTPVKLVGIKAPLPPGDEATLDLQVIAASAPGVKSIRVVEGANTNAGFVQQFATTIAAPAKYRPSVISASLGICEAELTGEASFVVQMERALKSATAAGITIVASTGDTGSTGCPTAGNAGAQRIASVQYPASSPWVTAVGGTNVSLSSSNRITEEVVWNDSPTMFGAGTGGYSGFFAKPPWQVGPGVGSGRKARSTPDVALLADPVPGYPIYCTASGCAGGWSPLAGTSAAAPLFASGVVIANQQAKAARQPRLGFLNRTIYKLAGRSSTRAKVFRDVRKVGNDLGKMIGPKFKAIGCCSATKYYDRASGWGSVNLARFSYEARKLGAASASGVAARR